MTYGRVIAAGVLFLNFLPVIALADQTPSTQKFGFHLTALYLQPSSNNLKYAVLVSGNQPYQQSWHNQSVNPDFSPAFDLGFNYIFPHSTYDVSLDWTHLNSNDSSSTQASTSTAVATVEFVAPPYDVGPGVFGIKRGESSVNFNFNNVTLNLNKTYMYDSNLQIKLSAGIDVLRIKQNINTTFSDYAGSPPISGQAYALPADPNFYFETENASKYLGIGPDVGASFAWDIMNGFGFAGDFLGTLTAGSMQAQDNFISNSTRLIALGISPSTQEITAPTTTQVVPGFDARLSAFYKHAWRNSFDVKFELGYRFAYYVNAISEISPDTLVQAGIDEVIPEFATGTMAINSTTSSSNPFSMQGPYISLVVDVL